MTTGSDIILGVARAADAVKQRDAAARLERMGRQAVGDVVASTSTTSSDTIADWSTELKRATSAVNSNAGHAAPTAVSSSSGIKDSPERKPDVYVQFEAVLLQNMVESMMPKDSEAMFGKGTAGEMWRSMLSEKIAGEIARSGVTGIAKHISAGEEVRNAAAAKMTSKVGDV